MFGLLRLALAIMVVLSHIGISFFTLSPGVIAVVVFYILAGFVVSHIYDDILPSSPYKTLYFYKDRILRIFPLYLFILVTTLLFVILTGFGDFHLSSKTLFANLTIIPLNFYMYTDFSVLQDSRGSWWFIPPAWSLGTELQAYILLALLIPRPKLKYIAFLISFFIYIIANLSYLHPDYFAYRFIIGVLFIFITGHMLQKATHRFKKPTSFEAISPYLVWISTLLLYIYFHYTNSFSPTYTKETLIGLLVGIPTVFILAKLPYKLSIDKLAGSLSYSVFLSHFLFIWIFEYFSYFITHSLFYIFTLLFCTLSFSYLATIFIEKPIQNYRLKNKKYSF